MTCDLCTVHQWQANDNEDATAGDSEQEEFESFHELMTEMDCEDYFTETSKGKGKAKVVEEIVKVALPGQIERVGNSIYCAGHRVGTINYGVHWQPPAMAANCAVHGSSCYFTSPLVGDDSVAEDEIVDWLGQAMTFRTGEDHMAFAPSSAYNKRQKR